MDGNTAAVLFCVIVAAFFVAIINGMEAHDKNESATQIAMAKAIMGNRTDIICTQLCSSCGIYCHSDKLYCIYDTWTQEKCILMNDMKGDIVVVK